MNIKTLIKEELNEKFLDFIKKSIDRVLKDYVITKGKYAHFIVKLPNEEHGILGYKNNNELYYYSPFWNEFFKKFSMERTEYEKVLIWYVGITYDWEVDAATRQLPILSSMLE